MSGPVLDIVTIDYIRLATFDFKLYIQLAAAMRQKWPGWRGSRWLQYKMEVHDSNHIKYGAGEQSGKAHGIFEATGTQAHIFFNWLIKVWSQEDLHRLYATRIDLQSTKTAHPDQDYIKLHKRLKKPKKLILGDEGNTLYIGNRESDTFWRLYDKTETHTRLEVEIKGKQAKIAWNLLINDKSKIAALYSRLIQRSRVPKMIAAHYQDCIVPVDEDELIQPADIDIETKFLWLARLDEFVYKLANDHTVGERMNELLTRWYEYTTKA